MKQRILNMMLMAFVCSTMALAQQVKEGELAVFYHMPLTQLAITIEYDEIATTPGPFYLYAERYMGAKEVVTEAQKRYAATDAWACIKLLEEMLHLDANGYMLEIIPEPEQALPAFPSPEELKKKAEIKENKKHASRQRKRHNTNNSRKRTRERRDKERLKSLDA